MDFHPFAIANPRVSLYFNKFRLVHFVVNSTTIFNVFLFMFFAAQS